MGIKKIIVMLLMIMASHISFAQYKPVNEGIGLKFKIANFGFDVNGSFSGIEGTILFDPQQVAASRFDVAIEANTVNTDNTLRDKHLKDESYFDVKNYPLIKLVSEKITQGKGGKTFVFAGQLTIKGKSKMISFPFTAIPGADGFLFKGGFKINRKDFGIGGTSTIADELEVTLNVNAKKSGS